MADRDESNVVRLADALRRMVETDRQRTPLDVIEQRLQVLAQALESTERRLRAIRQELADAELSSAGSRGQGAA